MKTRKLLIFCLSQLFLQVELDGDVELVLGFLRLRGKGDWLVDWLRGCLGLRRGEQLGGLGRGLVEGLRRLETRHALFEVVEVAQPEVSVFQSA